MERQLRTTLLGLSDNSTRQQKKNNENTSDEIDFFDFTMFTVVHVNKPNHYFFLYLFYHKIVMYSALPLQTTGIGLQ